MRATADRRPRRLVDLTRSRPRGAQALRRARQAMELVRAGDYGPEGVARIRDAAGGVIAVAPRKHTGSITAGLLDFLAEPGPGTARELFERLGSWAYELEEKEIGSEARADPYERAERCFGITRGQIERRYGDAPVLALNGLTVERVYAARCLAEAAGWLERAGLDDDEKRRWFCGEHPGSGSPSPLKALEGLEAMQALGLVLCKARDYRRQADLEEGPWAR